MSYRVLALKYRPQTFQDVIGQGHVTTTLSNAISANRVAHAILFTGPRGTGKTTIARILAKAMNCAHGPTATPCNICKSCKSITSGNCADVYEIDGASNNSVDQIRELRANVAYMPASSHCKIYIIDEVHMLSTAAFNALLKTLEEPPDHVFFIFATTESHKIPITILSRCQRHDLGRITLEQISAHLIKLCKEEGYQISKESTDIIASQADGSMRDALSLLDRIMSGSSQKEIPHGAILHNLGIIDKNIIFDISRAVLNHDGAALLEIIERTHESGLDLKKFYAGIIRHFRDLTVVKICSQTTSTKDLSNHDRETMKNMVDSCSQLYLSRMLHILLTEENLIKNASHTRTALEMVLLKLIQIQDGFSIDELIEKLDKLAKQITLSRLPEAAPTGTSNNSPDSSRKTNQNKEALPRSNDTIADTTEAFKTDNTGISLSANDSLPDWHGLMKKIGTTLPFVHAVLSKGKLNEISDNRIEFEVHGASFELSRLNSKRNLLDKICSDYFGKNMAFTLIDCTQPVQSEKTRENSPAVLKQEALSHPLVSHAVSLFQGNIVDVKLI